MRMAGTPVQILLTLHAGEPATSAGQVRRLVGLASRTGGHVTALILSPRADAHGLGDIFEDIAYRAQALQAKYEDAVDKMVRLVSDEAFQVGLTIDIEVKGYNRIFDQAIAESARGHDICFLPASIASEQSREVISAVVYRAGRAVLVFDERDEAPDVSRLGIVIWISSRQSARSIADSVPFLSLIEKTILVHFRTTDTADERESMLESVDYLHRRGLDAIAIQLPLYDEPIGDRILSFAGERQADLLIIGAPSHPGEASLQVDSTTTRVIEAATVPVLISA